MQKPIVGRIRKYLEAEREQMIALLGRLVQAESPSSVPEAQNDVMALLDAELAALDFDTTRMYGRATGGYLYARPKAPRHSKCYQILLGHCDTVWPVGTIDEMPFRVEGDVVRGPGVFDMKGGLVQMIFALRTLRELGLEPAVTPVVLINSDEEIGSRESGAQIRRLARHADRALVLEPALGVDGKLKTSRRGSGKFHIRVSGRSAHSGLDPERGASAILELSHVIQLLHTLNDPERGISVNVGMIEGGVSSNMIAAESSAVVDVRVASREDAKWITRRIRDLKPFTPGTSLEISGKMGRDPMEPTPRNRHLWALARNIGAELGIALEEGRSGGVSDANTTSKFTATLDGLGAVGDGAHARHEYVEIDRMPERTALLVMLLLQPQLTRATVREREISAYP